METTKATLYFQNGLGMFTKIEGHLAEHGRRQYAQYQNAPYVVIKPKRKQKFFQFIEGYKPTYVIVEGWGHPEIKDLGYTTEVIDGVTIKSSVGTMFSPERGNLFDQFIDSLGGKVIADYREVK